MAIKVIDSIPKEIKSRSSRDLIRADIEEALAKGISLFEFEGDYNYKYLQNYAREEADRIRRKKVREIQRSYCKEFLTDDEKNYEGFYVSHRMGWDYRRDWIHITSTKGEEHRRVFCQIDDYAEFEKKVIEDCKINLEHARQKHRLVDGKWEWIKEKRGREQ